MAASRPPGQRGLLIISRVLSLAALLFLFWLALSGHYTPWLIGAGIVVAVAVALFGRRLSYADREGHPIEFLLRAPGYWLWLAVEIAKSAWGVTRIILDPALPISPTMIRVRASQRSPVGVATYANSITLTPGTITVDIDRGGHELLVHALTAEGAADVASGGMDGRVRAFEARR